MIMAQGGAFMLSLLRSIVQEVNTARNLGQALSIIVGRVKEVTAADVCSIYLAEAASGDFVLMATDGLNPDAVGKIRLARGEGLVSLVAEREEPVNVSNADKHPRYRHFAESGEERYHNFLGVPVIHHRKVLGVLVVQQHEEQTFSEEMVSFLFTIAAQLAGSIVHAEATGGINGIHGMHPSALPHDSRPLQGIAGAPGVAIGTAVVVHPFADIDSIPDRHCDDPEGEQRRFLDAVDAVHGEIGMMMERMHGTLPAADSALFDAYLLMLDSDGFKDATLERIHGGNWAPGALRETVLEHTRAFEAMEDPYLRERAQDVRDLGRRVLQRIEQTQPQHQEYPANTVLVGEEISASMLAEVPPDRIAGVISVRGSRTSHMAILARALGIPAVMGADDLPVSRMDGLTVIADGYTGRVYINPDEVISSEFRRVQREEAQLTTELLALRPLPAQTPDGVHMPLYANTGLVSDITPSLNSGAEGIGLYRTEFPFMIRDRFPGEEDQRLVYRQVLESFAPRPVTMRTLDVGGDKALPYFPIEEDNPFLGWRGIRITLDHPEIFLTQIRAMLKANIGLGNLSLLLPMISNLPELDESIELIHRAHKELIEEGFEVPMPRIGVMVEVPSVVFQTERLAQRVDFLSVGTNDLTQYLLAVDRNNARVAGLYDSLHPAVLHALVTIVEGAHKHGKPVSVCGEMAGDPAAALLLLGMGMDSLSMSASSLPRVKWVIRSISSRRSRELLADALQMENAKSVRDKLEGALEDAGLGGLIRAGK